jgi:hypothetical protein
MSLSRAVLGIPVTFGVGTTAIIILLGHVPPGLAKICDIYYRILGYKPSKCQNVETRTPFRLYKAQVPIFIAYKSL